jgi:hypothetical protein
MVLAYIGAAHPAISMVGAVEAGFRHEEVLLDLPGGTCPPPCVAEHATLLCALHRVMPRVESGDVELGREVVDAMDAVLMLPWQAALCPAPLADPGTHARIPRPAPGSPAGRRSHG